MASRMVRRASVPPVEAPMATVLSVVIRSDGRAESGRVLAARGLASTQGRRPGRAP